MLNFLYMKKKAEVNISEAISLYLEDSDISEEESGKEFMAPIRVQINA